MITQKESSRRGASGVGVPVPDSATNLAGREGRDLGLGCQVTAAAAAPVDPTGPSSRPEAGEVRTATPIQLFTFRGFLEFSSSFSVTVFHLTLCQASHQCLSLEASTSCGTCIKEMSDIDSTGS